MLKNTLPVRACNLVQNDSLDLALVNMEQYNIDKFHHALLANDQVVFCVSKEHPLVRKEEATIQDMAQLPLIFFNGRLRPEPAPENPV